MLPTSGTTTKAIACWWEMNARNQPYFSLKWDGNLINRRKKSSKLKLDDILRDIGLGIIDFPAIRNTAQDFAVQYGLPSTHSSGNAGNSTSQGSSTGSTASRSSGTANQSQGSQGGQSGATGGTTQGTQTAGSNQKKTVAVAIQDPRAVKRMLKNFKPKGNNREKVVTLRDEALKLKLDETPLAFCFVLRSMFEISAKAYCDDHKRSGGPSYKKTSGQDRSLVDVLRDITQHLTNRNTDQAMVKVLHGSMVELGKADGILSVTSMNQLVHNPRFSIRAGDISTLFGNIFPLLEAMN